MPLEVGGTITTTGANLFKETSSQSFRQESQKQIGRTLEKRGKDMFSSVRATIASRHTRTGNLLARLNGHAPYKSISEQQFIRKDALFAVVGIYDRPGENIRQRNTTARAFVGTMLEYGSKQRLTRSSSAYRGRIGRKRIISKAAKLTGDERRINSALRTARQRAARYRAKERRKI